MKQHLAFGWLGFAAVSVQACTIFVLTDTDRVLYCNNEDARNPMTRIWFVPASEGRYGAHTSVATTRQSQASRRTRPT